MNRWKCSFMVVCLLAFGVSSDAFSGICTEHVLNDPHLSKAIDFLKTFEGRFKLGSCEIELQVCNSAGGSDSGIENLVADLLVTDKTGFQRYIPFYFSKYHSRLSSEVHHVFRRSFLYRFKDKNFDPASGATERWDVEFVKTSDLKSLKYIEIGYTSQVQRENHINKRWIICGSEREKQLHFNSQFQDLWLEFIPKNSNLTQEPPEGVY